MKKYLRVGAIAGELTENAEWYILFWFVKVVKKANSQLVHSLFKAEQYNGEERFGP